MDGVMSPRIVLGAAPLEELAPVGAGELGADPLYGPPLPRDLGGVPVWSEVLRCSVGSAPAWEFRHPEHGRCLVLQSIAPTADGRHVYAAWVPADARDGGNPVFAQLAPVLVAVGTLAAWWPCLETDGTLRPELDDGAAAAAVAAAWPAAWRVRLETDAPDAAPTGPLMLAEVIA